MIPEFLSRALDGVPLVVFCDGTQSRDFTYVGNVVAATLAAGERRLDRPPICNVGCGSWHTVLALAEALGRVTERALQIEYVPARPRGARGSLADMSNATTTFGHTSSADVGMGRADCLSSLGQDQTSPAKRGEIL